MNTRNKSGKSPFAETQAKVVATRKKSGGFTAIKAKK